MSYLLIPMGLVVFVAVLTSAVTTLVLGTVVDRSPRVDRAAFAQASRLGQHVTSEPASYIPSRGDEPPLLHDRSGCGCLTVPGAIALLEEEGYRRARRLDEGGVLLATGEAAVAVWPHSSDGIAAVQFGSLSTGPDDGQPASHLGAAGLRAASRNHRASLASRAPQTAPPTPNDVLVDEPVYPLNTLQATAQHGVWYEAAGTNGVAASRMLEGRPAD